MLTPREQLVLDCLKSDPMASQQCIADQLGMSRSAVAVHISNLGSKGVIRGRGYVIDEQPYVVAIGGANVDITGKAHAALRRDDSNPGCIRVSPGGVARNVAENLNRLDLPCRLVSIVGDDRHGDMLIDMCRERGMPLDDIVREPGATTSTYLALMDERGALDAGIASMDILGRLDSQALNRRRATIEHARALFVDANVCDDALAWLFREFASKRIVADPVSVSKAAALKPYLGKIDILKPSLSEAAALLGQNRASHRDAGRLAERLRALGVAEVYVSLGERGVYVAGDGVGERIPAARREDCRDVSGAGDAMTAGIMAARLSGRTPPEAAEMGIAAANILMSTQGASSAVLSTQSVQRIHAKTERPDIRPA